MFFMQRVQNLCLESRWLTLPTLQLEDLVQLELILPQVVMVLFAFTPLLPSQHRFFTHFHDVT